MRGDVDAAYHEKYDRYGPGPVGAVTGPDVLETTLRFMPRDWGLIGGGPRGRARNHGHARRRRRARGRCRRGARYRSGSTRR
ncbi:hypothetical protein [Salinactinospora qingdaonensis]|uniref:hypothetical protein n=1 Tax=Salinactinospora qingdaonensis TaxID=702744 RepID=UPI003CD05656